LLGWDEECRFRFQIKKTSRPLTDLSSSALTICDEQNSAPDDRSLSKCEMMGVEDLKNLENPEQQIAEAGEDWPLVSHGRELVCLHLIDTATLERELGSRQRTYILYEVFVQFEGILVGRLSY